jgi:serine/threonine protein kinase
MARSAGDRFDRYIIERLVGRGGMGEVWRAMDPKLDRRVALKLLSPASSFDPRWDKARERMLREARSAAALNHPNVVAVFDVGEVDDTPYIAMELVEGVTLREYIGDASVSLRRRAEWTIEIARALAAAHQSNIVHRDVKPENVMVRYDGTLKVLDFGIARRARVDALGLSERAASVVTNDGELVGTLPYMAPEQFDGSGADARADQFAWGILAIELLTGGHPWPSKGSPVAILDAICRQAAPLVESSPELPPALPSAIARAVSKSSRDRFESMDALLDAIEGSKRMAALRRPPALATATEGATSRGALAADPLLTLGSLLAGRFELVRLLGRGGMGEVYEAIDRTDGARVALKTVRGDRAADPLVVERFRREIALARRVVHPNVARVVDACVHESAAEPQPMLLLAMELLVGESLADLLLRRGALSIDEARPIAREMAAALGAAHAAGVVHRDFKSANVFLEPRPDGGLRVVVTDFGLARTLDASDATDVNLSRDVALL